MNTAGPALLFLSTLWITGMSCAVAADQAPPVQKDLHRLDSSIDAVRDALQKAQQSQVAAEQKLKRVEERIGRIGKKLHDISADLKAQQRQLSHHQERRQALQQEFDQNAESLRKQVRAAYFAGRQEFVKLLFNQENPATLGRVLAYYDYYHQARLNRMQQITDKISNITQLEQTIQQDQDRLQNLQNGYQQERLALQTSQQERTHVLGLINREIHTKDQQLAKLLDQKKHLENVLTTLQNQAEDSLSDPENGRPFAYYKGQLDWPTAGTVSQRFGSTRIGGLKWQGVVISAEEGQEVRGVAAGRIAFADWLPGYGMVIIVDHGKEYLSLYGYNRALLRKKGDWVDKGEAIAVVGNSGGLGKPGLYFEIRHRSKAQNPLAWLNQHQQSRQAKGD